MNTSPFPAPSRGAGFSPRGASAPLPADRAILDGTSHDPEAADRFHEECGIFAIWGHPEAAKLTYLGLYALQHRGQ